MNNVLIIDDEFGIAEALTALLLDEGYRVSAAVNGKQGFDKLSEERPDLVIVDYMMPIMNGAAVLRAMKADSRFAHIPTILMSAVAESSIKDQAQGYDAFLRKPFDEKQLLTLIRRLTERR